MKLDSGLVTRDLSEVPAAARKAEELGFDALWSMEAGNDAFLPLALAAEHTSRLKLGPSVAIAFPRSPMATAYTAWDLAALSKGRFVWWPEATEPTKPLEAYEAQLLMAAGDLSWVRAAPMWRRVGVLK